MFSGKFPNTRIKSKKIPAKKRKYLLIFEISFFIFLIIFGVIILFFGETIFFQAEIRKLDNDIKVFKNNLSMYKYKYRYFPGDDKFATKNFRNFDLIQNGNGTDFIGDNLKVNEEQQAIRHLRAAGLMKGDPDEYPLNYPSNPFNGVYKFSYRMYKKHGEKYQVNVIIATRVPKKTAREYDARFDNGDINSGLVVFEPNQQNNKIGNLVFKLDIY